MFAAKIIASMSVATIAGLGGLSFLDVAIDQHFEQYREVARLTCSADVSSYPKDYRQAAEQICLTKKIAIIDAQLAPIKRITGLLAYADKS